MLPKRVFDINRGAVLRINSNSKCSRGQVSTELLILVGVILLLFIPLILVTYFKASEANDQVMQLQAQVVSMRLAELSNAVGGSGGNSSVIAEVFVPSSLTGINVTGQGGGGEVIAYVNGRDGVSGLASLVRYPIADASFVFQESGLARFEISRHGDSEVVGQENSNKIVIRRLE